MIKADIREIQEAAQQIFDRFHQEVMAVWAAKRSRHIATEDFWLLVDGVLDDYRYKRFDYYAEQNSLAKPAYFTVTFPMQHIPDSETCEEILRHFAGALDRYCMAVGWNIRWFAAYKKSDNYLTLTLYYCEHTDEMPDLVRMRQREIALASSPEYGVLSEYVGEVRQKPTDILLGYRAEDWEQYGIKKPIYWSLTEANSAAIVGITGSGKSTMAQTVVLQLLRAGFEVTIADYKAGGDWDGIVKNYAEGDGCDAVINNFYDRFREAREKKTPASRRQVLVIDEFSSLALSKSGAEFKEFMAKIGQLAFMGRSYGFSLLILSQALPSTVMDTTIRDQLAVKVHLGQQISATAAQMLFPNTEIDKAARLPEHCGYYSTPSCSLGVMLLPTINNTQDLKPLLKKAGNLRNAEDDS